MLKKLIVKIFDSVDAGTKNSVGYINSYDETGAKLVSTSSGRGGNGGEAKGKQMNIHNKILQFIKERQMAERCVDNLVYRVSKDEAVEIVKYYLDSFNKLAPTWETQTVMINAEFSIKMASEGEFKMLREFVSSTISLFGVEIYPDWQEYTNKNMYY